MSGVLPDTFAGWAGYVAAGLTAAGVWIRDRRRGDIDESANILQKWKELVEQHQSDIKDLRDEFGIYKKEAMTEIAGLRERLIIAENRAVTLEKRVGELEAENAGLKRAIAQNSQSAAYQIGRRDGQSVQREADFMERLDRAGHNSREDDA